MHLRRSIWLKLLVAFALPAVALFALFGWFAHDQAREELDAELGSRLAAIAASTSTQIRGKYLIDLESGDEGARAYQNTLRKLEAVTAQTGVRFLVFDRGFIVRVDTGGEAALGARLYQAELDRLELARVFTDGVALASVTFDGADGKIYKAGYAPVRASENEPEIVLALAAQAPAGYFDRLAALRQRMLVLGAMFAGVVVLASLGAAWLLTRNLRRLAAAAERIGAGDLAAPVEVRSGDEIGALARTMDQMRVRLAGRDAEMQQMLAGIAHEVRNPLAGMALYAGILREELPVDDERRGHTHKIEREIGHLERVVNEFLAYARRPPLERSRFSVAALLAELMPLVATDRVMLHADGDAIVLADRDQLRRALLNLLQNAVQATTAAAAGDVTIRCRDDAGDVLIEVRNPGPEIPPAVEAKLFAPFFTTKEKGTGLGLAFARDCAHAHGGTLTYRRDLEATCFTLRVPRDPAAGKG